MPADAEDDFDFMPTELDLERVKTMEPGGKVKSEMGGWEVMRWRLTWDLIIRSENPMERDSVLTFHSLRDLLKYFEL